MQAIILCGGKGERLGSVTNTVPKGMVRLDGKPLLEYQIDWLRNNGVTRVIFACGYLSEAIQDYFGDGRKFSLQIDYSIEAEQLGRGGAIKKAWKKLLPEQAFIVTNGDILTEINLTNVVVVHKRLPNIKATICLFPYKSFYGVVKCDEDNFASAFEEKPTLPFWINGGIYIFEYDIKDYFPDKGEHELVVFPRLVRERLLYCYKSQEPWRSIETIKDLNKRSNSFKKSYAFNNS